VFNNQFLFGKKKKKLLEIEKVCEYFSRVVKDFAITMFEMCPYP